MGLGAILMTAGFAWIAANPGLAQDTPFEEITKKCKRLP